MERSKSRLYERQLYELPHAELQKVREALKQDVLKIRVLSHWREDHCACVGIRLAGVQFGFWCLTDECAGAFDYSDSKRAQKNIRQLIKDTLPKRFAVRTERGQKDKVVAMVKELDENAWFWFDPKGNPVTYPVTFWVETILNLGELEEIAGVKDVVSSRI